MSRFLSQRFLYTIVSVLGACVACTDPSSPGVDDENTIQLQQQPLSAANYWFARKQCRYGACAGSRAATGGSAGSSASAGTSAGSAPVASAGARAPAGSGGSSPTAGSGGAVAPTATYTLTVSSPRDNASVQGAVVVTGQVVGFVNVEIWDSQHQSPALAHATLKADGSFSASIDTRSLAAGATVWTVHAWDVPPGGNATQHASASLALTVTNPSSVDAGTVVPPVSSRAFVMGAENKDGTHDEFNAATQCETNLRQLTTGWCNDWGNWESSGCGRVGDAQQFFQASPLHAVELSLAPWPWALSGQSLGACARGDYNGHYANLARALLAAGLTHVSIRLGYEWDGNWFPWGTGLQSTGSVTSSGPGGTALEYAGCFKQFDSAIQAVAKTSSKPQYWRMVMNPIHDTFGNMSSQLQQVLDAAGGKRANGGSVDIMGVDIYDYPARNNFDSRMQASIAFAKRNGMPLSVPEWGVGGDSTAEPAVDNAGVSFVQGMGKYFGDPANNILYGSYFNCASGCAGNHSIIAPNNPTSRQTFVSVFGNGKLGCGANARTALEQL
jgi:hypothetical protein